MVAETNSTLEELIICWSDIMDWFCEQPDSDEVRALMAELERKFRYYWVLQGGAVPRY